MKVDLHTHSTCSDGTLEPEDLIRRAAECGITHLALSDHDSTAGLEAARRQAAGHGMEIIPAVEINTKDNISIHILGYYVDEASPDFQAVLSRHRELRTRRAQQILEKLHRMGIRIHLPEANDGKRGSAVGRPHIADQLKEMGIVFSRQEAFDKYLSQGRPAFVAYENGPTPKDAIDAILASKGIPVLAHPGFFVSAETIESLVQIGLQGIEVFYPSHRPEQIKHFLDIAGARNLIATGGSDYHGPNSGHERIGEVFAPEKTVGELLERKHKLFG